MYQSLIRSGAENFTAKKVIEKIKLKLFEGITTRKIYNLGFKELRKIDNPTASRYEIKWAIMRLGKGEQGFSFEEYVSRIFEKLGYKTKLNVIAKGKNITHEIDLVIEKGNEKIMVECKHRSKPGIWIHIKVPLYVYARYMDLKTKFTGAYIVTNARFSKQSQDYAKGVNLKLIGWNCPKFSSLKELADQTLVYPVTVLKSIDDKTLQTLLDAKLVVVTDIIENHDQLHSLIGNKKADELINEAKQLQKKGKVSSPKKFRTN